MPPANVPRFETRDRRLLNREQLEAVLATEAPVERDGRPKGKEKPGYREAGPRFQALGISFRTEDDLDLDTRGQETLVQEVREALSRHAAPLSCPPHRNPIPALAEDAFRRIKDKGGRAWSLQRAIGISRAKESS